MRLTHGEREQAYKAIDRADRSATRMYHHVMAGPCDIEAQRLFNRVTRKASAFRAFAARVAYERF